MSAKLVTASMSVWKSKPKTLVDNSVSNAFKPDGQGLQYMVPKYCRPRNVQIMSPTIQTVSHLQEKFTQLMSELELVLEVVLALVKSPHGSEEPPAGFTLSDDPVNRSKLGSNNEL